ncbi:RIO-like serine/threonine protein kinase [Streptomyces filamentosus]
MRTTVEAPFAFLVRPDGLFKVIDWPTGTTSTLQHPLRGA